MTKEAKVEEVVQTDRIKFEGRRDSIIASFIAGVPFIKRKVTQDACWYSIDKDLANQYIREEVWIFGFKIRDFVKTTQHGKDDDEASNSSSKLGFSSTKR